MDAVSCTHRLHEELREEGLTLVSELKAGSDYAFIARNASAIIVVFRGTCTFGNVLTDLNYLDSGGKAAERLAEVTGIDLPAGVHLHRGFTESYLNLREELVATLRQSSAAKDCAGHGCHAWHADGGTRHAVVDGGVHESHADALRSVLDVDVNMHDDGARASPPELILTGPSTGCGLITTRRPLPSPRPQLYSLLTLKPHPRASTLALSPILRSWSSHSQP